MATRDDGSARADRQQRPGIGFASARYAFFAATFFAGFTFST
jgi:hypothetical protein